MIGFGDFFAAAAAAAAVSAKSLSRYGWRWDKGKKKFWARRILDEHQNKYFSRDSRNKHKEVG